MGVPEVGLECRPGAILRSCAIPLDDTGLEFSGFVDDGIGRGNELL